MVSGATVRLRGASGTPDRQTLTDSDGSYLFTGVTPGEFLLTVTLQGFDSSTTKGILQQGQDFDLPVIALRKSVAHFSVEVELPPHERAAEQVRVEEQQRLFAVLPNFFVSYRWDTPPLTARQKFSLAWANARDPGNLVLAGAVAGVQQATDAFPGYGQGAQGYGKRYGANAANLVIGTFMGGAVLPSLFRQDPRYFYKGTGTVRSRLVYALSRAVIARGDNGKWQPAYASILGDLSEGAISNLYYPESDRHGAGLTVENGFLGVAGDALNNVFQEFILRRLTAKAGKLAPPKGDAASTSGPANPSGSTNGP